MLINLLISNLKTMTLTLNNFNFEFVNIKFDFIFHIPFQLVHESMNFNHN